MAFFSVNSKPNNLEFTFIDIDIHNIPFFLINHQQQSKFDSKFLNIFEKQISVK